MEIKLISSFIRARVLDNDGNIHPSPQLELFINIECIESKQRMDISIKYPLSKKSNLLADIQIYFKQMLAYKLQDEGFTFQNITQMHTFINDAVNPPLTQFFTFENGTIVLA